MSMLQHCKENKSAAVAFYFTGLEILQTHCIEVAHKSLTAICAEHSLNRTQVYEKKGQLEAAAAQITILGKGRPRHDKTVAVTVSSQMDKLRISVLEYCLSHPGTCVIHSSGRATYSDGYKRYILDLDDIWEGTDEQFSRATDLPLPTLNNWRAIDVREPIQPEVRGTFRPHWPSEPNEIARQIAEDFQKWEGSLMYFLRHEGPKVQIAPNRICSVLRIAKLIGSRNSSKPYRYPGSTEKASPGTISVTDGKDIEVRLTSSDEVKTFNWQGTVDQATACHTAVVVTDTESAAAVRAAYDQTTALQGRPPSAQVHDNKPIYSDKNLRQHIEKNTVMIPATLGKPENKAIIEGEFGKFEQQVGTIILDDSDKESLVKSAAREAIRAYVAGINHAGRTEFDGKSRLEVLRESCPDPQKDAELIAKIKSRHPGGKFPGHQLPFSPVSLKLLNEGFADFDIHYLDESGRLRSWLARRFEPEGIIRALAIFGVKYQAGALRGKYIHRYLVKLIRSCQEDIELEREEVLLLKYAEIAKNEWLFQFDQTLLALQQEFTTVEDLILRIAEHALFGSIFIEKAYWEKQLINILADHGHLFERVIKHIRRLYEASASDRRRLMGRLISWQTGLDRFNHSRQSDRHSSLAAG